MAVTATWNEVSFVEAYWWALLILIGVILGIVLLVGAWKRRKGEAAEDEENTGGQTRARENVKQRRGRGG